MQYLDELIKLSLDVGREDRQLAILGEGNTSADAGDGTFWIKASGTSLSTANASSFSHIRMDAVLDYVERAAHERSGSRRGTGRCAGGPHPQAAVHRDLYARRAAGRRRRQVGGPRPSGLLQRDPVQQAGRRAFHAPMFPDGIVVCGRYPAVVPYVDPGFYLGHAIRNELRRYQDAHGTNPKLLLMVNHGITALGQTAQEALNIMRMADKWSRISAWAPTPRAAQTTCPKKKPSASTSAWTRSIAARCWPGSSTLKGHG